MHLAAKLTEAIHKPDRGQTLLLSFLAAEKYATAAGSTTELEWTMLNVNMQ